MVGIAATPLTCAQPIHAFRHNDANHVADSYAHQRERHCPRRDQPRSPPCAGRGSDCFARALTKGLRFTANRFVARPYGHRVVVLETVATVPGMVGATLQQLKCLRRMSDDQDWIVTLLDEGENKRIHLMTFIDGMRSSRLERLVVRIVQGVFCNFSSCSISSARARRTA